MMYACFVQVAGSEQLLGVQLQHFDNMFNAEIRNKKYCCCDQPSTPCVDNIENLNTENCTYMCQPYFVIYFQACPSIQTCYFTDKYVVSGESIAAASSIVIQIPFNESGLEMYNQVRICVELNIKNSIIIMT